MTTGARERPLDREVRRRLRRLKRTIGDDLGRSLDDTGATKAQVAALAQVDRSFIGRILTGDANPSLETLVALGTVLGADVSVRFFAGTGPRLTDRHQARMVEAVLADLAPAWRPHLEVPVWRPARGVIDAVLERLDSPLLVVAEFMSTLQRLEQQIRWAAEKAGSIASSDLVSDRPVPPVSTLLVLRSTATNREIARRFEVTLRTAYPATAADAIRSLTTGGPWPGAAIVWIRIEGEAVEVLHGPPRGVALGR